MKFRIQKDILLENLTHVSKAISSKNIVPVLSGIKFELKEEGLYLTASDNDITIQSFIDRKKIDEIMNLGSVVLQGRYILEIIRKLPDNNINVELIDEYKVWIHCSNSEFNLNAIDPREYPATFMEDSKLPILMLKSTIKNIVNQTSFATSTQESRPLLTGINFKFEKNNLECIATDSYRLAKKIITLKEKINESINIVIPCRNILELIKVMKDDNEKVEMHIFSNKVLFKFDNILFQSRLLNGTYPDTSKLIPENHTISIKIPLNDLYDVVDRASLLSSDKEKNIIKLETKDDYMIISSSSPEVGRVEEKLKIEKLINNDIIISFSAKYMLDAIKALNGQKGVLYFNNEVKPIILKDLEDDTITQLILPIRTY